MTFGFIISKILVYIIIFGGLSIGIFNLIDAIKKKTGKRFSDILWTKWFYSAIGFYLSIAYSYLELFIKSDHYLYTSTYIRPSIAVLVVLLLVGKQRPVYLPDVLREIMKKFKEKRGVDKCRKLA